MIRIDGTLATFPGGFAVLAAVSSAGVPTPAVILSQQQPDGFAQNPANTDEPHPQGTNLGIYSFSEPCVLASGVE